MSKVVMLNKEGVLIDIVDHVRPVKKSRKGVTILCAPEEAEGYVGSDNDTVYARVGMQFQPTFYDIARLYQVEEVPAIIEPLAYKYNPEDGFTVNEDTYPDTNLGLTKKSASLEEMVMEISEIIYA